MHDQHKTEVRQKTKSVQPAPSAPVLNPQFREFTINEHNIPNEPTFDDAMVTFLLEMLMGEAGVASLDDEGAVSGTGN